MARNRGKNSFSGNLELKLTAPLDARTLVPSVIELTQTDTWADSENKIWLYNNIVVAVEENNGLYMLTNYDPVSSPLAYTEAANWVRVDATAAHIDVVDNLTSTDSDKALAASQGKVLNEKIEEVKQQLSSVYDYKGSVDTFAALPTNATKGDVYNVVAANGNVPAGTNYAWNGESWDALGGSVDLSGYYTKTEVDNLVSGSTEELSLTVSELSTTVDGHTTALNVINGAEETTGSLANTLKVAKDYTDTLLLNYVEKVEGSSLITSEKLTLIDTNKANIDELTPVVEANKADLLKLNGDANTEGSILNIVNTNINNALSWQEI